MDKKYIKKNLVVFIIACLCLFIIKIYFFSLGKVDGNSMYPTLHDHDYVFLNKIAYKIGEPKRFDIIMFTLPDNSVLIKRVIGLPGERVEYKNSMLYINGTIVKEHFHKEITNDFDLEQMIDSKTVPVGNVFVMGDNREYSTDSREFGTIPSTDILGSATKIWSLY